MCPAPYYMLLKSDDHRMTLRDQLVRSARKDGIRAAARRFGCSRNTVRKWLRRAREGSFEELSRAPRRSPSQTPPDREEAVASARRETGYGPHRLRDWLTSTGGPKLSVWTIRNILKRRGLLKRKSRRHACYPAHWAWEAREPFSLVQCDVKDVYDKGTLGTERTTHLARLNLPRYQWTFLEGKSRLRFLAYSRGLNQDCGLAFLLICLWWVGRWKARPCGEVQIQIDWGMEFGGDNPRKVDLLNRKYFAPLGARLCRYPKGRKGYNGRIERLHRSDDEEFYKPMLLDIGGPLDYLDRAFKWQAFYNLRRPHYRNGMDGSTPMQKLAALGLKLKETFALLPPVILDPIAGPIVTPQPGGHDVQAHYIRTRTRLDEAGSRRQPRMMSLSVMDERCFSLSTDRSARRTRAAPPSVHQTDTRQPPTPAHAAPSTSPRYHRDPACAADTLLRHFSQHTIITPTVKKPVAISVRSWAVVILWKPTRSPSPVATQDTSRQNAPMPVTSTTTGSTGSSRTNGRASSEKIAQHPAPASAATAAPEPSPPPSAPLPCVSASTTAPPNPRTRANTVRRSALSAEKTLNSAMASGAA